MTSRDRTVRRRWVAVGVAGLVVAAAGTAGAVALADEGGDRRPDSEGAPLVTDVPMWTVGSTLHTPDTSHDLGVDVVSFVRTSAGIVFAASDGDDEGPFGVYAYSGEGEPERIGETLNPGLRADPDQPYVGWVDGVAEGDRAAVVYDQAAGRRVWSDAADRDRSSRVEAIDDGTAYLSAEPGTPRTVDLTSGAEGMIGGPGRFRHLRAVGGGWAAWAVEKDDGADAAVEITALDSGRVRFDHQGGDGAAISPDGRWISIVSEQVTVLDTATGRQVEVDPGGRPVGFGYDWLDGDTLLTLAGDSTDPDEIALLSCEIPAGTCAVQARLPSREQAVFAISVGEALP